MIEHIEAYRVIADIKRPSKPHISLNGGRWSYAPSKSLSFNAEAYKFCNGLNGFRTEITQSGFMTGAKS